MRKKVLARQEAFFKATRAMIAETEAMTEEAGLEKRREGDKFQPSADYDFRDTANLRKFSDVRPVPIDFCQTSSLTSRLKFSP